MSDQPVASLVTTKSDVELAKAYRDRLAPLLEQACEVVTEARRNHGLHIGFNLTPDGFGRQTVQNFSVTKSLL